MGVVNKGRLVVPATVTGCFRVCLLHRRCVLVPVDLQFLFLSTAWKWGRPTPASINREAVLVLFYPSHRVFGEIHVVLSLAAPVFFKYLITLKLKSQIFW